MTLGTRFTPFVHLVFLPYCPCLYLFNRFGKSRFSTLPLLSPPPQNSSALTLECREKLATASPRAWSERDIPMAPKRSASKGKVDDAAVGEAEVHGWKSSKCTDSHLLDLVGKHLLQPGV